MIRLLLAVPPALFVLAGCGSDPRPGSVQVEGERQLRLGTECARDVSARITESATEIRIDRVRGVRMATHDCAGVVDFELDRPIGDRAVRVNGERWMRVDGYCDTPDVEHDPKMFWPVSSARSSPDIVPKKCFRVAGEPVPDSTFARWPEDSG